MLNFARNTKKREKRWDEKIKRPITKQKLWDTQRRRNGLRTTQLVFQGQYHQICRLTMLTIHRAGRRIILYTLSSFHGSNATMNPPILLIPRRRFHHSFWVSILRFFLALIHFPASEAFMALHHNSSVGVIRRLSPRLGISPYRVTEGNVRVTRELTGSLKTSQSAPGTSFARLLLMPTTNEERNGCSDCSNHKGHHSTNHSSHSGSHGLFRL